MNPIRSFDECIRELTDMVSHQNDPETQVMAALDIIDRTLQGREHLDLSRFVPSSTSYARHLLHCDPQDRFCLLGLVWKPGQGTPIHDHPSWGVYGVLENRIRFVDYLLMDSEEGQRLTKTGVAVATAGSAVTILPPLSDVHRMENPCDEALSMTLHCYGQEVKEFNIYQRDGSTHRKGSVSYDSVPEGA